MFANPLTAMLTGFVRDIGIEVRDANLPGADAQFQRVMARRGGLSAW